MKKGLFVLACVLGLATIGVASAQTINSSYLQNLLNNFQSQANILRIDQLAQVAASRVGASASGQTSESVLGGVCAGGGSLPRAAFGQMFFCNGNNWVPAGSLWTNGQSIRLPRLAGAGGAYVCVDFQGNLFRSNTNCTDVAAALRPAEISFVLGEDSLFRHLVYTHPSQLTTDVSLGSFRFNVRNQAATITAVSFMISKNSPMSLSSILTNVRLTDGVNTYNAAAVSADGRVVFNNLNFRLTSDQSKSLTLKADVPAGVGRVSVLAKLLASSLVGVSANADTINLVAGAGDVLAQDVIFSLAQPPLAVRAAISTALGYDNLFSQMVNTSSSDITPNVSLGTFRLMTQNQDATINGLKFMITRSNSVALTSLISNVRLTDGANTYAATSVSADGQITFSGLNLRVTLNQWKDLTLKVDAVAGASGQILTKLLASGIVGTSANSEPLDTAMATDITAGNVVFRLYQQ